MTGVGLDDWSDDEFREHMRDVLAAHAAELDADVRKEMAEEISFRQADVTDADAVREAIGQRDEPFAAYLASPSTLFAAT